MLVKWEDAYPNSPHFRGLQPLKIPSGWMVEWNELDTTAMVEEGHFGGSSSFRARHKPRAAQILSRQMLFRPGIRQGRRLIPR